MFQVPFFIALLMLCGQLTLSKASCCNIADRLDARQSFLVPIPGKACLRVQVYAGGKIQVDPDDSTCTAGNFLSASLADFEDYSGNVATYAEGQLGFKSTVIILEDASLTEVLYDLNFGGEFIEVVIKVPSCSVPITPTSVPTSSPIIPTSVPTSSPIIPTSVPTSSPITQQDILIDLYESTGGYYWPINDGSLDNYWLSSVNECEWYGVTCNGDGDVIELKLEDNLLTGTIPDSLGDLSNLYSLYLNQNFLSGTIPASLGDLSNLEMLYLGFNYLTGTIPASLSDLSSVEKLFLKENALTGTIPDSLGNLSNLLRLSLSYNDLTGTIPDSFGNFSDMLVLALGYNELTGTIPPEVCVLDIPTFVYVGNQIEGECE